MFQEYFMEELCYISKRFLCPDGTFVLQRDIEYWKSLTTSKGAGTYKDSKSFSFNPPRLVDRNTANSQIRQHDRQIFRDNHGQLENVPPFTLL